MDASGGGEFGGTLEVLDAGGVLDGPGHAFDTISRFQIDLRAFELVGGLKLRLDGGKEGPGAVGVGGTELDSAEQVEDEAEGAHLGHDSLSLLGRPFLELPGELDPLEAGLGDDLQAAVEGGLFFEGPEHDGEAGRGWRRSLGFGFGEGLGDGRGGG